MPRTADYTILGFLYQFNKTLIEILNASADATITVEGIIEDIDVADANQLTAIQCKYHETKSTFTLSDIFKPILQMMDHYSRNNSHDITYRIFAHFADEAERQQQLLRDDLENVLATRDARLAPLVARVQGNIDLDAFRERLLLDFGPSFDDLATQAHDLLKAAAPTDADVETLLYPNALHKISLIASRHDVADREVTKDSFLRQLLDIRRTAISRWTLALATRKKLLDTRRKQLHPHLKQNTRLRHILISASDVADFDDRIVIFISDYVSAFHFKALHIHTPLFCLDCPHQQFVDICRRTHQKGVKFTDGIVAGQFDQSHFLREPLVRQDKPKGMLREFDIRLLHFESHGSVITDAKSDDFFVVSRRQLGNLDLKDVNVERLEVSNLVELSYLLRLSDVYE